MGRPTDFRKIEKKLADREWRLDNLYLIQDVEARTIKFRRNPAQCAFWSNLWYLNVVLKGRQLGFSTFIALIMLDAALFNRNIKCGIIDLTLDDAKKKLDKIRFAYEHLPSGIKQAVPLVADNATSLEFANGSEIEVGTSHRGGTLQYLHVSEFGKIAAQFADKAREIRTGAFGTIHKGQFIFVESTAEGTGGDFYDMVESARALEAQKRKPSELEFKLHFFPWWLHSGYVLPADALPIPGEISSYAAKLKAERGITLSLEQVAWYAAKVKQIGSDDMLREYPSFIDEAFQSSVAGAYFKAQLLRARQQGRIGKVPYDPTKEVNTFWDIGVDDETAIWFHQTDGRANRLIDYYANSGEGILHYVNELKRRRELYAYSYGKHYGPHDLQVRDWTSDAKPRVEIAAGLGIKFEVVQRVQDKADAIEAARTFLEMCWIDEERCSEGIRCLENYRKEWNERLQNYHNRPLHDWASHGADSLMTGAVGFRPLARRPEERRKRPNLSHLLT
jgi:hypothetical protein